MQINTHPEPKTENFQLFSKEALLFYFIVFIHLFFSVQGIKEYFLYGHQGFNGSLRSTIGRNYVRYGFWKLKFKPVKNPGIIKSQDKEIVHWHHPPLVQILTGTAFYIFGESEAAARSVPITASMIILFLLFFMTRKQFGSLAALLTISAYTLFPMITEYGKMVNYESVVIAFALGGLYFLTKVDENNRKSACTIIASLLFLASAFTDWPGFIFAGFAGLYVILFKPRNFKFFIITGIAASILLFFTWYWLNAYSGNESLFGLAKWRAGQTGSKVTFSAFSHRTLARFRDYFGIIPSITGIVWFILYPVFKRKFEIITFVFGFSTVLYLFIFSYGAWVHVFFMQYFAPWLAVSFGAGASFGITFILKNSKNIANTFKSVNFLKKITSEHNILIFIKVLFAIAAVFTVYFQFLIINKAKFISYEVRKTINTGQAELPYSGRLDVVLLGKLVNSMTKPDDTVFIHFKSNSSPQLRYYMGRRTKRIRSFFSLKGASVLLTPAHAIPQKTQRSLASKHPVIKTLRYLIYDLKTRIKKPQIIYLEFKTYPSDWRWAYFHSIFYPPHKLVYNRRKSMEYRRYLGL